MESVGILETVPEGTEGDVSSAPLSPQHSLDHTCLGRLLLHPFLVLVANKGYSLDAIRGPHP